MPNRDLLDSSVQQCTGWLTRRLFLRAYELSDDAFWRRDRTPHRWLSLGGLVEFAGDFLAVSEDGGKPVYLATFRAAPHIDLKHVSVKIKVKKAGAIHEQRIDLDSLTSVPVRKALNGIPLKPKRSKSTRGAKLGDVYIKLVAAIDSDGVDLIDGRKVANIFGPTCTLAALNRYEQRWGQYWNVDEINLARQQIKNHWYRELVQSVGQLWRPLRLRRTAFWLLTNPVALSLTFWSQNLFDATALREAVATGAFRRDRLRIMDENVDAPQVHHGRPMAAAA